MLTKYTNRRLLFWDALIGAVGGFFGNIANVQAQQDINAQNIAFAKEMYAQQRSDSLADREHMEQYNDPSSQMQRLANAGLNPNLVYGNGSAVNTVNQLPHQATANMPNLQAPRINPDMLNIAQVLANIDLAKSQAKKNLAEANESEAKTNYTVTLTAAQNMYNDVYDYTMDALKEKPYLENSLTEQQIDNVTMQTSLLTVQLGLTVEQTRLISEQILEVQSKINLLAAQTGLTKQQIITETFKQENLKSQSTLNYAQAAVQPALAGMYRSIAEFNDENTSFNKDTHLIRYTQENNKLTQQVVEVGKIIADTNQTKAETTETQVSTGSRILDGLINIGDAAIRVLDYRSRRAKPTKVGFGR